MMEGLKPPPTIVMKKPQFSNSAINLREKSNWLIHAMFLRQEYDEGLKLIEEMLEVS